jgi:hypothetical protein
MPGDARVALVIAQALVPGLRRRKQELAAD